MILNFFWNLITFIIALSVLISIHECGHFLAARFFNVKVEKFSIGFGPVLWTWKDSYNTEYVISAILFGGYVKLLNSNEDLTCFPHYQRNSFNNQNIWKKIIIIFSGPVFNFIFSIFVYMFLFIIGIPENKPIIHHVIPQSVSFKSGISSGLEIQSVNNVKTNNWESVRIQLLRSIGQEKIFISAQSIDKKKVLTYVLNLSRNWCNTLQTMNVKDPVVALGILPKNFHILPIISNIRSDSYASCSGLKIGDKILSINETILTMQQESLKTIIQNISSKNIKFSVERNNKILEYYVYCTIHQKLQCESILEIVGISPTIVVFPVKYDFFHQNNFLESLFLACNKTWQLICMIVTIFFNFFSGYINITNLGGPIAIAQGAGESAKSGLIFYLMFLAVTSINLGVFNLLPLPALDGGHLLFLIIEILHGKSISQKIQDFGYIIGFIILILIMGLTIINDILKLWHP